MGNASSSPTKDTVDRKHTKRSPTKQRTAHGKKLPTSSPADTESSSSRTSTPTSNLQMAAYPPPPQQQGGASSLLTQVSKDGSGPDQKALEKAKRDRREKAKQEQARQALAHQQTALQEEEEEISMLPPQPETLRGRPLLVLDLDETLVHSSFKPVTIPDMIIPIEIKGNIHQVYVKKRPFVDDFLARVSEFWEVAVFTASVSEYANPVLDDLDPDGLWIHHRLFREHCSYTNGLYVKDMGLLGRPLQQIIIIDNSPTAYLFHPRNALPVTSWFDDTSDTELQDLMPALDELAQCEDIYPLLEEFRNALTGLGV